jgi:DNA (cytosine-5)-methyltransferase 1
MRYLSVCSGIEAASVAWEPLGWSPAAFSEIEPFPAAVLAHRWPEVPNLGDMKLYEEWKNLDTIDLLVGGTPCQSFSVAGLRKGLKDPRGGLMLTYLEIARCFRPRWIVWENVPGVLSSDGGRDFGSFLGALGELGYGWAYRVLDAQWIRTQRHPRAVPQRRRRVFVVGCLGDRTRAAKVLFESQSVCRDYAEGRKKKEDVAGTFKARARSGGWCQDVDLASSGYMQVAGALDTECGGNKLTHQTLLNGHALAVGALSADDGEQGLTTVQAAKSGMLVPARMVAFGEYVEDGTASAMKARDYKDATDLVAIPLQEVGKRTGKSTDDPRAGSGIGNENDAMYTLQAGAQHGVAQVQRASGGGKIENPTAQALRSGAEHNYQFARFGMTVRRLTPTECERLQGFPDNHTMIPWKKKPADQCPDGPRYKALGNSMAVNCMEWIGQRIAFYDKQS